MDTPILDFLKDYRQTGTSRLHMPGHKGRGPLGCEPWDITEIRGADSLYEAEGIIARSEENAARLFGTRRTFYSTGGSSQCVKAMLCLALTHRPAGTAPVVLAARNAHKSFLHAAALLDLKVEWLWSEEAWSLCSCHVSPEGLETALARMETPPFAVYVTTPDYLGNELAVSQLARVCRRHGTLLLADNAHGAYLPFVGRDDMAGSADLWCASAHKTLPVLTGGAYLHIGKNAPAGIEADARQALALFGSTSPSYLILASLDACNAYLAGEGPERMRAMAGSMEALKARLGEQGWAFTAGDPLKLTLDAGSRGWTGPELAALLRRGGVEPEFADPDYVVLMASGNTTGEELGRVEGILSAAGEEKRPPRSPGQVCPAHWRPRQVLSIREALFSPGESVSVEQAVGRVCAAPAVSCPPAIPILVCGEELDRTALECFRYYGISQCSVVTR